MKDSIENAGLETGKPGRRLWQGPGQERYVSGVGQGEKGVLGLWVQIMQAGMGRGGGFVKYIGGEFT